MQSSRTNGRYEVKTVCFEKNKKCSLEVFHFIKTSMCLLLFFFLITKYTTRTVHILPFCFLLYIALYVYRAGVRGGGQNGAFDQGLVLTIYIEKYFIWKSCIGANRGGGLRDISTPDFKISSLK